MYIHCMIQNSFIHNKQNPCTVERNVGETVFYLGLVFLPKFNVRATTKYLVNYSKDKHLKQPRCHFTVGSPAAFLFGVWPKSVYTRRFFTQQPPLYRVYKWLTKSYFYTESKLWFSGIAKRW